MAFAIFAILLFGVVDFGRAIYQYNGVSQAAREIARVASVHPGSPLGSSAQVTAVVSTQKNLIPSLGSPTFNCVDIAGGAVAGTCGSGNWVRVSIHAPYKAIAPFLGLLGTFDMQGTSSVQIQ